MRHSLPAKGLESAYTFLRRSVMRNVSSCQNIESPFHICFLNLTYYCEQSP